VNAIHADREHATHCDTVRALSFTACDGELSVTELAMIEAHLPACRSCQTRIAADAAFHRAVRNAASLDSAPDALRARLMQLLQQHATANAPA
jgi:mycothiol system anti-sigma-R factor